MWDNFIIKYCEVDFLCVNSAPNWLGWTLLIGVGLLFSFCVLAMLGSSFESADNARRLKESAENT